MNVRALAIHETAHAVAGICLGRVGLLEWLSIESTENREGGCKWSPAARAREGAEYEAVIFAGPVGQLLYAPESLGPDLDLFRVTINQPLTLLQARGLLGWCSTDLQPFLLRGRIEEMAKKVGGRIACDGLSLEEIEWRVKRLLGQPNVGRAITTVADRLMTEQQIVGKVAEGLIRENLTGDDYAAVDYLLP